MKYDPRELAAALAMELRDTTDAEAQKKIAGFSTLLKEHGIAYLAPAVLAALPAAIDAAEGIEHVHVGATRKLKPAELQAVLRTHGFDPKKVRVTQSESPEHLGGYRIRTKERVIDASVGGTLAALSKKLEG